MDRKVSAFLNEHGCLVGTSMVLGHLRSVGLNIQREWVRKCLARVDPHNVRIHWAITVLRWAYSVAGPNSLWHLDGHHSLITWGFVIHGAIHGFSRLVTFLHCSTNNRSGAVADLFVNATQEYGWPSRVLTDHGGENTQLWQLMEDRRGPNRGSFLVGCSTHNQRIERLWWDVFKCVAHTLYSVIGKSILYVNTFKLTVVRPCKKCMYLIKRDKHSIKTNVQHQTHGLHVLGKFESSKTKKRRKANNTRSIINTSIVL